MAYRLVAVEGPLTGKVHDLVDPEITLGRSPSNMIVIPDASVSRRHCVLKREGDEYSLCDLDSMHGTQVNGEPIKSRLLSHGDKLRIGTAGFVFIATTREGEIPEMVIELRDSPLSAETTVQLKTDDSLHLQPRRLLQSSAAAGRAARDLDLLLRIGTAISTEPSSEALGSRLLDLLFEALPARRGAVVLLNRCSGDIEPLCVRSTGTVAVGPLTVSRTIVQHSLRENVSVWCKNVMDDPAWSQAQSLIGARVRSVLCAPLKVLDRSLGAIYLDTSDAGPVFVDNDLHLITAVAAVASAPLDRARQMEWLQGENSRLVAAANPNMVGDSAAMRELHRLIARVAPTDSTVLLRGESGTGKELAARAIHQGSPRAEKPFVAINCASLSEQLLESELFGHEKGAFTGAIARKTGKFEVADQGTVFLDEIGEMPVALQVKLLRVLQEREFERVGGTRPIHVDIRIIAATNRDLEQAVAAGEFRQDLYYRLNVVSVALPPLRERPEDVPVLANHFCEIYARRFHRRVTGVSPEAIECLQGYAWPGNVRELQNAIERAVVMGLDDVVLIEDLPEAITERAPAAGAPEARYHDVLNATKKEVILRAIEKSGGVITEAAKLLGLNPNYLHRLMKNLDLKNATK